MRLSGKLPQRSLYQNVQLFLWETRLSTQCITIYNIIQNSLRAIRSRSAYKYYKTQSFFTYKNPSEMNSDLSSGKAISFTYIKYRRGPGPGLCRSGRTVLWFGGSPC